MTSVNIVIDKVMDKNQINSQTIIDKENINP